jgi:hypothetical protein
MEHPEASFAVEAARLERIVDESFAAEKSPNGRAWAPLVRASFDARSATDAVRRVRSSLAAAPSYRVVGRSRPRTDLPTTPGVRSGALRAGIIVADDGRAIKAVDSVPHAPYRQWGTRRNGRRRMAARAFLPVTGSGRPVTTGPAGDWYRGLFDRLARFVVTGREE